MTGAGAHAVIAVDAPAKINLALHVVGQRADGYHEIESLVAFAAPPLADRVVVRFGEAHDRPPVLTLDGPFARGLPTDRTNLALAAAHAREGVVSVGLTKRLPVASGIGGGSADAAAVLRAIASRTGVSLDAFSEAALGFGADVPACLYGVPTLMAGIGERLKPLVLPREGGIVLLNPGVPVGTRAVFAGLASRRNAGLPATPVLADVEALADHLRRTRNDLEAPATALAPQIAAATEALWQQSGCLFARMSGSGATVFGLFPTLEHAQQAAEALARPTWWVGASPFSHAAAD